jgi:hypothetical protein
MRVTLDDARVAQCIQVDLQLAHILKTLNPKGGEGGFIPTNTAVDVTGFEPL